MKISTEKPPVWDEIHKHFEVDDGATIYTYGDTLYNPGRINLWPELLEHETLHTKQQEEAGGADKWWQKFFAEPAFRYEQECLAYAKQYAYVCTVNNNRDYRAKYLWQLAKILSGATYKTGVPFNTAMRDIRVHSAQYNYAK